MNGKISLKIKNIDKFIQYYCGCLQNSRLQNGYCCHCERDNLENCLISYRNTVFKEIQNEYQSFSNYLDSFEKEIIYEYDKTTNYLSDNISNDLYKRGMRFVGSTIIYSYLQAIGRINGHEKSCYLFKINK